nr:hypothetical protein [Novosphingobium marinum]
MVLTGLYYGKLALAAPDAPAGATLVPYVVVVVVLSVVVQIVLAVANPKEADAPADERERAIIARAGNWSGIALGAGVISAAIGFTAHGNGTLFFHLVIGALIASQVLEYLFQIVLYRRGV